MKKVKMKISCKITIHKNFNPLRYKNVVFILIYKIFMKIYETYRKIQGFVSKHVSILLI